MQHLDLNQFIESLDKNDANSDLARFDLSREEIDLFIERRALRQRGYNAREIKAFLSTDKWAG